MAVILLMASWAAASPAATRVQPPEFDVDEACLTKLTPNCTTQLNQAFQAQKFVEDPNCCRIMIRLGDVCWESLIRALVDQCHVLPQIMQHCKAMTGFAPPSRKMQMKSLPIS